MQNPKIWKNYVFLYLIPKISKMLSEKKLSQELLQTPMYNSLNFCINKGMPQTKKQRYFFLHVCLLIFAITV